MCFNQSHSITKPKQGLPYKYVIMFKVSFWVEASIHRGHSLRSFPCDTRKGATAPLTPENQTPKPTPNRRPMEGNLFLRRIKMKVEKRTKIVKSRFNETEIELLRTNANGEPLGAFLRNAGLGNTIKEVYKIKKIYTPVDPDLIFELQKLGINLNQIARKVNQDSKSGMPLELFHILSELTKITESLNEIKEAHTYDRKVF